ncbi:hypothetical protein TYRP_021521 [Tyrophagus putrescentiae]|nr:hypothetical protein TYRP_021521 [Tyrophagus putrescentiae]
MDGVICNYSIQINSGNRSGSPWLHLTYQERPTPIVLTLALRSARPRGGHCLEVSVKLEFPRALLPCTDNSDNSALRAAHWLHLGDCQRPPPSDYLCPDRSPLRKKAIGRSTGPPRQLAVAPQVKQDLSRRLVTVHRL